MEIKYKDIQAIDVQEKQTIYKYLKSKGYSENFLKNLRKSFGYIKLNGEPCIITTLVKENDIISVNVNPNTKTSINSCIIPLDIVYEDEDVLAINKPSMLPTMPSRSHYAYNLSGAIVAYMNDKQENFVVRIVNRLDKEASGIVLVAKNSLASNFLNNLENTTKTYYALCNGIIDENIVIDTNIDTLINQYGSNDSGKKAKTFVEVVKKYKDYTLVKIQLEQGRTHQIRVHLSSIGHALLGDSIYGTKSELINHTALVCKEIDFNHPTQNKKIHLEIDFPDDFKKLI